MDLQISKDPPTHYHIHIPFFSAAHGTLLKINHVLRQTVSLNKHRKTEKKTQNILIEGNGIYLDINSNRNCRK